MSLFPDGKRERGLIQYLQGLAYRVTMRISHRYNWHYAPPIYPENDIQLWCQWCGFRQTIKKGPPSLRVIGEAVGCDMESTSIPPDLRYRHNCDRVMSNNEIKGRCREAELLHEMAQTWHNAESVVRLHNRAMKIINAEI